MLWNKISTNSLSLPTPIQKKPNSKKKPALLKFLSSDLNSWETCFLEDSLAIPA